MAEKELSYRLDDPDFWMVGSPYWRPAPIRISRIYLPVSSTVVWLTEFDGEFRVAFAETTLGQSQGPWSVPYTPAFDIANYLIELTRTGEMP